MGNMACADRGVALNTIGDVLCPGERAYPLGDRIEAVLGVRGVPISRTGYVRAGS